MKKFLMILLLLSLSAFSAFALADGEEATATLRKFTAPVSSTELDLGDTKANLGELENFLDQFPNLEKVDMFSIPVTAKQIEELTARYPGVKFGWTIKMAEHTVRTDQTAFSTLHFSGAKTHNSATFEPLKYCTELLALDLGHNAVDDLSFLYNLPNLRVLIVACNKVTDLTPIASLKDLEYLEIFSNRITDLSPLTSLEHLVDLNIAYNAITDYTPLTEMKQLRRLWLYRGSTYAKGGKYLTDDVVAMLQEALPDTHIDASSQPTLGGWREDPHFDVIHESFYSGVYQPFADSWFLDDSETAASAE